MMIRLAVNLLHALHEIEFADDRQRAQFLQHGIPRGRCDFEIHPRAGFGVLDDRDGSDIAVMPGHHAGKAVQNTRAGIGVDQKTVTMCIHTGAIISV